MLRTAVLLAALGGVTATAHGLSSRPPQASTTVLERPADFAQARLQGVQWQAGALSLLPGASSGAVTGTVGNLSAFDELIPSWNAVTPAGSSITLEVRPQGAGLHAEERFYSFGIWQSGAGRSSLNGQKDGLAQLMTDTLRLNTPASSFEYRLILRSAGTSSPRVRLLAFSTSLRAQRSVALGAAGNPALWNKVLDVPLRSQMVYKGGGEVWCSPTSTSMILAYYGVNHPVPEVAAATYDAAYEGTGNWPFNTAYAGAQGLRAVVTRLPSLAEAEKYIAAGVPLGVSLGWRKGELPGAAIASSDGHLMVLVGFDAQGNPVLNDPAAPTEAGVRRSYPRAAFETLWLSHSGGLVYLISKPGQALP